LPTDIATGILIRLSVLEPASVILNPHANKSREKKKKKKLGVGRK
jgi:hypothetical protein